MGNLELSQKALLSIIFTILIVVLVYVLTMPQRLNNDNYFDQIIEKKFDEIKSEQIKSQRKIDSMYLIIESANVRLEELQKQKEQIKIIYIRNNEKIDTVNVNDLVDMFREFFSKSNR